MLSCIRTAEVGSGNNFFAKDHTVQAAPASTYFISSFPPVKSSANFNKENNTHGLFSLLAIKRKLQIFKPASKAMSRLLNGAQKQAHDYGAKVTGCTVHFVDEGCDTGPIIAQKAIEILPGDTLATLSARILEEEHRLYPGEIKVLSLQ